MIFFDFHHHDLLKNGIYNLHFEEKIPSIPFSIGLHPMDIDDNWETNFEKIQSIAQRQNCLAIGECGLDAFVKSDLNLQKVIFKAHVLWANEIGKPVIIHCVRRFSELLPLSKIAKTQLIVHGFNKKESVAKMLLEKGFYLSFGKAILHRVSLQQVLKEIPLERFFLETDDNDFNIEALYQKVSEIKKITIHQLVKQMEYNKQQVFYG